MPRWVEETLHKHWRARLKADAILHESRSAHQHIVILDNGDFGRMLLIDGVVQLSTRDEFIYHEMMAHTPLLSLDRPKRVLIVGGGDGGVLREVLKHPSIARVDLCEIDQSVIDLSLRFFPDISKGAFDDRRVHVTIADGTRFVAESSQTFDAIICDTTEPVGVAKVLFSQEFFANCRRRLATPGVFITQNGLPFMDPGHLAQSGRFLRTSFADAACFLCGQPTYFGGPFAWRGRHRQAMPQDLQAGHRAAHGRAQNCCALLQPGGASRIVPAADLRELAVRGRHRHHRASVTPRPHR
jgi:spermidine synthase